jgi:acetyl esterase/lipase
LISWLFLAVSLWGAAFTWNALFPFFGGARRSAASFAAGWLTSELAVHHLAWQAAATLLFGLLGAFGAWPGKLGLAITTLSWLGLAAAQLRAARTGLVTEDALRQGFGADYRERILPNLRESLSDAIHWRRVVQPLPIKTPGVERTKDILYARERGVNLKLDVYRPRTHPVGCPVLLQVHGGGWVGGSKNEQALPLMYELASHGWVCVSADYRLSPHATFPDHLVDLKRALRWVKEHVAEYGGDPHFVVVTGGSAGGHLAALLALTQNDPTFQPGFEEADTSVQGCVPFYGVYDFLDRSSAWKHSGLRRMLERQVMKGSPEEIPEQWEQASPISHVHADAPPFFVIHGERDSLVPVADARAFVKALRERSKSPVAYAELPGAQHAFELFPSVRTLRTNQAVARFLAVLQSRHALGQGETAARAPSSASPDARVLH